jgi:hypothetical protein
MENQCKIADLFAFHICIEQNMAFFNLETKKAVSVTNFKNMFNFLSSYGLIFTYLKALTLKLENRPPLLLGVEVPTIATAY